jgi:acyl phosphate:glycerol-3-phosphate acyltransferase
MMFWIAAAVGLGVAYLLGSIPTGYLAGRWRGIDLRQHGSKSVGATNALRTLGPLPGLAVLAVDVSKGAAAVLFAQWFFPWAARVSSGATVTAVEAQALLPWTVCAAGLAALVGHSRSIWLNFAGGKSAATGLGVLLAMAWPVGVGAAVMFGAVVALFRIASLASMLAALTAIALVLALEEPLAYRLLVAAGGVYVIALHRANIARLIAGTEPRVGL